MRSLPKIMSVFGFQNYGEKTMSAKFRIYILAIKYWLQGDKWSDAVEYATAIVRGFHK